MIPGREAGTSLSEASLWEAAGRLLFVLAMAAGFAWVVRDSLTPTYEHEERLAKELERSRRLLASLDKETEALEREIRALDSDPYYVEFVLRTQYGFRRPGEIAIPVVGRTKRPK